MTSFTIKPPDRWGVIARGPVEKVLENYRRFADSPKTPKVDRVFKDRVHLTAWMTEDELMAWIRDREFVNERVRPGDVLFFVRNPDRPPRSGTLGHSLNDLYENVRVTKHHAPATPGATEAR